MTIQQLKTQRKAPSPSKASLKKSASSASVDTTAETESLSSNSSSTTPSSVVSNYSAPMKEQVEGRLDPNLWYIYGHGYDLTQFVPKHPGGTLALLSGQGRDCTALFESYHPWNDRHRKVLKAYGPAPPPDCPFYVELKEAVRKAFPEGVAGTKMRPSTFKMLLALQTLCMFLFFYVQTPLSCLAAGVLMALFGTRLAHEGGHHQVSQNQWINRFAQFYGFFPTGPSMCWYYQHVISHHAHTNQDHDCDVEYIHLADMFGSMIPFGRLMKTLATPTLGLGAMVEIGPKRLIVDLLLKRSVGGNKVYWHIGQLLPEAIIWCLVHWFLGPSMICYLCMWFTAGNIFVPMSQLAHAIVFPDHKKHDSWAKMQIAESVDFATDSNFWYHVAFGLTTQIEHHLFPSIGHHCYDKIRTLVAPIAKAHDVPYNDLPIDRALSVLWHRWVHGVPMKIE
jgi:fatty acid desaturase